MSSDHEEARRVSLKNVKGMRNTCQGSVQCDLVLALIGRQADSRGKIPYPYPSRHVLYAYSDSVQRCSSVVVRTVA